MTLLDIFFPKVCLGCNKNRGYICKDCITKIRFDRLSYGLNYSVFEYSGLIKKVLITLKYKFAYDIADEIVSYFITFLKEEPLFNKGSNSFILIPIPLHVTRYKWRGFNQSELLGRKVSKIMNWKFIPDLLVRIKATKPQVGLKGRLRRINMSNVFEINHKYLELKYNSYSYIIFDDVYTTGSTINEARKTLSAFTKNKIYSLTIARQSRHF